MPNIKDFRRIDTDDNFFGVLSGLAYLFKIPVWMLRIAFIVAVIYSVPVILFYLVIAFCVPAYEKIPEDYEKICE